MLACAKIFHFGGPTFFIGVYSLRGFVPMLGHRKGTSRTPMAYQALHRDHHEYVKIGFV